MMMQLIPKFDIVVNQKNLNGHIIRKTAAKHMSTIRKIMLWSNFILNTLCEYKLDTSQKILQAITDYKIKSISTTKYDTVYRAFFFKVLQLYNALKRINCFERSPLEGRKLND